jgi:hypothetical protein
MRRLVVGFIILAFISTGALLAWWQLLAPRATFKEAVRAAFGIETTIREKP